MKSGFEKAKIEQTAWQGEPAVKFCAGGYEALLIPGIGANLIVLRDTERGLDLLRTPEDMDTFKARPQVYGIPVLFPPNRIEDGTFAASERVYHFPVNEPNEHHNHIHGFLYNRPWTVTRVEVADQDTAEVEAAFVVDKNTDFFEYFPHEFTFKLLYRLSKEGLTQEVSITNQSSSPMPVGLGFHTAFKVPFHSGSKAEDYRVKVTVGRKWELSSRMLPTGILMDLDEKEQGFLTEGVVPQGFPISGHFTSRPVLKEGTGFQGAVIRDADRGVQLVYEAGQGYKHWVVWNETGDKKFICPEPQTWMINAPNVKLPPEVTGFMLLKPEKVWKGSCRIYVEAI